MRKLYPMLFGCLLALAAPAQDLGDTLVKYSYLLQGRGAASHIQATGFFVRYQHRLFFATAAHCLSGWDPFQYRRIENFPDTLYIRLSNDTSKLQFLPVPVTHLKESVQPFREYERPDVYVLEIKNPRKYKVYSVERFIKQQQPRCETIETAWVYGFPHPVVNNDYLRERQHATGGSVEIKDAYCVYAFRPEAKRPDELNYYMNVDRTTSGPGLSGAPVYLFTDDWKLIFGGIYLGGAERGLRYGLVLRPEYVLEKIVTEMAQR